MSRGQAVLWLRRQRARREGGSRLIGTRVALAAGRDCAGVGALSCARARRSPRCPWQRDCSGVAAGLYLVLAARCACRPLAPRRPSLRINKTAAREDAAGRALV